MAAASRNRVRFTLEMLEAMREAVGPDFIVGIRMSGDEMLEGESVSPEESLEIATIHAEFGPDRLHQRHRLPTSTPTSASRKLIPTMGQRTAPFLEHARAIKQATGMPVFHATRITDLEHGPPRHRRGLGRHGRR